MPAALFEAAVLLGLAVIGAIVASRQPRNAISWILCVSPLFAGLLVLCAHLYWALALGAAEPGGWAELVAWVGNWAGIPVVIPTLTLFPLLFPTGRLLTQRWTVALWVAVTANVLVLVGTALAPGRLEMYPIDNPYAAGQVFTAVNSVGGALLGVAALTSLCSLGFRFRRSRGDEREQLKWVVAAAATLFLIVFVVPLDKLPLTGLGNFAILLVGMLVIASGVAVAMLRYHLYDIDIVINRTLVYGALTAMLAATYLGSVLVLQLVLESITAGSGLAVAASTLATAAIARPARARIQEAVDRKFFRRKYDAARTLERFGAHVRSEVDLDAVTAELRSVVAETMQPAHLTLWVPAGLSMTNSRNDFRTQNR
ncbi:MAG: hypothetical protein ACJ716_06115 [Marmoricola sp.]